MEHFDLGLKDKLAELMGGSASAEILAKLIMIALTAANVEILSPHYRANRDGSETAVPASDAG